MSRRTYIIPVKLKLTDEQKAFITVYHMEITDAPKISEEYCDQSEDVFHQLMELGICDMSDQHGAVFTMLGLVVRMAFYQGSYEIGDK